MDLENKQYADKMKYIWRTLFIIYIDNNEITYNNEIHENMMMDTIVEHTRYLTIKLHVLRTVCRHNEIHEYIMIYIIIYIHVHDINK
jgi:hypothetical protein